ncbi:MAG: CBS domain-containing protein [Flavobacteriales bacterium]|nr:CBS domain-containing protein [Flavobacteriales bacterium]
MIEKVNKHLISKDATIKEALIKLNYLASDAILFVVDENKTLIGSLTDGDLRRGFIKGNTFENSILEFTQNNPAFIYENENNLEKLESFKEKKLKIIPVLNKENKIVDIVVFRETSTILPVDAVIMAGGRGIRLKPLTDNTPKPMLKVGNKPIIEHNIDRLTKVGITNFKISVNYLSDQIENYFSDGHEKGIEIEYLKEDKPLGTIGSILLVKEFKNREILIMNSDLLTNIDFKDFYSMFRESDADMAVAATSYHVDIPYAVMEVDKNNVVKSLKEKPRYTYYSNAGIYLVKSELLNLIPINSFFDITDLMNIVIEKKLRLVTYPINGYWLDIGKHEDYNKAKEDIKHLKL